LEDKVPSGVIKHGLLEIVPLLNFIIDDFHAPSYRPPIKSGVFPMIFGDVPSHGPAIGSLCRSPRLAASRVATSLGWQVMARVKSDFLNGFCLKIWYSLSGLLWMIVY